MTATELQILLVILQGLLATPGVVAIINGWMARGKARSDINDSVAQSLEHILGPLNERIAGLENQVLAFADAAEKLKAEREEREKRHQEEIAGMRKVQVQLRAEVDELRGGVQVLIAQMEANDPPMVPRWKPRTGPLNR